jgi:hypothetical protein
MMAMDQASHMLTISKKINACQTNLPLWNRFPGALNLHGNGSHAQHLVLSVILTVCLCPRPEKTLSASCGSNPCASILTAYDPGFSWGKLKRPASSVLALRFDPVSWLVTVTMAPGTTAPVASVAWPTIALVVSP